jgi:Tfp pilus assembly pilus retraction ATPase PilT
MGRLLDIIQSDSEKHHEGDREAIREIMIATCEQAVTEVIKLNRWKNTPDVIALGAAADAKYKNVLVGQGKLLDFQEAIEKWKKAGTR